MEHYVIALGVYVVLMLGLYIHKLYNQIRNESQIHYQNGTEQAKTQDVINRRANHSENTNFEGLYIPRSNPTIPPPNEYEASSIEEFESWEGHEIEMPFELWVAKVEHDTFIEYMRSNLNEQGIEMIQDTNR